MNELFQNVRFLKFYGWGSCAATDLLELILTALTETRWTDRVRQARETELGWRVKENFVNVAISFIWYVRLYLCHG